MARNMQSKVSVDNYMFNESMCIMQFLGFMIDDYKYNIREVVGKLETNYGMKSSIDLGRDFFEPR